MRNENWKEEVAYLPDCFYVANSVKGEPSKIDLDKVYAAIPKEFLELKYPFKRVRIWDGVISWMPEPFVYVVIADSKRPVPYIVYAR